MKRIFILFMCLFAADVARAQASWLPDVIEMRDLKTLPYGYTGTWVNQPGARTEFSLFVKLERNVKDLGNNVFRVEIKYPVIPQEVLLNDGLPQIGQKFKCGVRTDKTDRQLQLIRVESFQHAFHNLNPNAPDFGELDGDTSKSSICAVTVKVLNPVTNDEAHGINWSSVITAGLPDVRLRETHVAEKAYADLVQPYVDFLSNNDVKFRTDDEFWFLASASIYLEPALTGDFLESTPGYVENWVINFAANVVERVSKYKEYFNAYLLDKVGSVPTHIESTYPIAAFSKEVVYEM
jgi:hypothetical protein